MSNWALRRGEASRFDWPGIPDTPIDFSIPYRSREKGASRHFGFFPFFAKKPWPVVQEYIRHYTGPGDLVCDPFAGSGVTPVEALVLGRRAIAGDINPVARFITQMTAIAPINLIRLSETFNKVSSVAKDAILSLDEMTDSEMQDPLADLDYPRDSIPVTVSGQSPVLDLPTRANYVEHEIERIIVAYLGADIELITSSVIQQVLDSRAFHNYRENPEGVTEDIQKILKGPRFVPWQTDDKAVQWLMAPSVVLDSSLDELDRMRYYVFDLLWRQDLVTEGNVRQYLLTRLSEEHDLEPILSDVPALLRTVGREVEPHVWRFEPKKVFDYKQLRLLFRPSRADEIRDWIEHNQVKHGRKPLHINPEGFALLADLLSEANDSNPQFETQYIRLQDVLQTIFERLGMSFDEQIERVIGIGDWTRFGIDLRNLPYEDVVIEIVLSSPERPFRLYQQIAQEVFTDLRDEDIHVQFRLITLQEWQHAESLAKVNGQEDMLGITLLSR